MNVNAISPRYNAQKNFNALHLYRVPRNWSNTKSPEELLKIVAASAKQVEKNKSTLVNTLVRFFTRKQPAKNWTVIQDPVQTNDQRLNILLATDETAESIEKYNTRLTPKEISKMLNFKTTPSLKEIALGTLRIEREARVKAEENTQILLALEPRANVFEVDTTDDLIKQLKKVI